MQSTGQGATQSPHPEHSDGSTACIRFGAPRIASTGQASMHKVQPMQSGSSMTASCNGVCSPHSGSSGFAARPVNVASAAMTGSPPGGQRLISDNPAASASA